MNEEISNKLNGYFEVDETYENSNWIRTKIRTFAFGKNRNQSDIINTSMSQFSKAQKSVGAIPIVARYNDAKDDLEGHNVILRKNKDDEYEMYHDTDALGFTSPTSTFYMEEVNEGTDFSPDYKTYIVIEDVYLWKRFDATRKILEWKSQGTPAKVSMEISDVSGSFDSEGYFTISDFVFTGIAALGSDVEPCFPKAEIQLYTVNDFKADLKQLMYELTAQDDVDEQGGNDKLEETKQEFETKVESTEETVVEMTDVANVTEENPTEEFTEDATEQTEVTEDVEETKEESTETEVVEEFENVTTEETQVEDVVETTEDVTDEAEATQEANEFEVKFNELSSQFENLQTELAELREFKRTSLETELSAKFEGQLTSEELAQVFEQSKSVSIADIEKELFALVGKKNFSIQNEKPVTKIAVDVHKDVQSKTKEPYGGLFAKHLNN